MVSTIYFYEIERIDKNKIRGKKLKTVETVVK